ncbi:MAG: hypothetical protein K9J12_05810 [Melioribacteraceae bacterium]|nr:hypothetical protein [Melioribacteraceae bacterium]MCF8265345.1 hypothetical protein [Melioribacteraceae bacterium]
MKMIKKYILLIFMILSISLSAQDNTNNAADAISEMNLIFSNLDYNTIAFDDLRQKWFISDPELVRDVFSRFVVTNSLRKNGLPVSLDSIQAQVDYIYEGEVIIDLQRRYYDNEIDQFAFVRADLVSAENPVYMFDPVDDGFYLKSIIGPTLYEKLKEQIYFFSNISKDPFDTKTGYYFDVEINALNGRMMYWTTTSSARNKYLVALFSKWGHNNIYFPGWSLGEVVLGTELTYYEKLGDDPRNYNYRVRLGTSVPSGKVAKSAIPDVPIFKSSQNIYYNISGDLLKPFWDIEDIYIELEGMFAFGEYTYSDYELKRKTEFYSMQNFFGMKVEYRNIFNLFDLGMFEAGARIFSHDMHHFEADASRLTALDANKGLFDKFTHFFGLDWGVRKRGGLVQHHVMADFGYSSAGYGYVGMRAKVTVSDTYGYEIVFYNNLGLDPAEYPYRNDTYLMFSSILHINY